MNNSHYKIKVDFEKCRGSYVFDKTTGREYLDMHGMFSSLALGYTHPAFGTNKYLSDILAISHLRNTNCEYLSDLQQEFEKLFQEMCGQGFSYFHYACTGALAIEWAVKTAFAYKQNLNPLIAVHSCGFHGISGIGNIVTDHIGATKERFENNCFYDNYNAQRFSNAKELEDLLSNNKNISAILIDPVKCTQGDIYSAPDFFTDVRAIATKYDVPLIFDEIQTGFFTTGKPWYFNHLGIQPDIVVFGKKAQVSGIMATEKFSNIFSTPEKMCITYDGDLIDMVRCTYNLQIIEKENLQENARLQGDYFKKRLNSLGLTNVRGCGLLLAFDIQQETKRNDFRKRLFQNGMICNISNQETIRLRPHLAITTEDVDKAINIIQNSI